MMLFLRLLALIAVAWGYWKWRKAPQALAGMMIGILVAAVVVLLFTLRGNPEDRRMVRAAQSQSGSMGQMLGRAVAEAFPDGGDLLVVTRGPFTDDMVRMKKSEMEGFLDGLGAAPFRGIEKFPARPNAEPELFPLDGQMTVEHFQRLLEHAPNARAVVLLAGTPEFPAKPPVSLPPLFVLHLNNLQSARRLMDWGVLRAGVLQKSDPNLSLPTPDMTPEEVFGLRYEMVRL